MWFWLISSASPSSPLGCLVGSEGLAFFLIIFVCTVYMMMLLCDDMDILLRFYIIIFLYINIIM